MPKVTNHKSGWKPQLNQLSYKIIDETLVIESMTPFKILSSAVLNGGLRTCKAIVNKQVSKTFRVKACEKYLIEVVSELGLEPKTTAGFLTAAEVKDFSVQEIASRNFSVTCIATAGLSYPAVPGEDAAVSGKSNTINIFVFSDADLTDSALVNAVQTVTEAKSHALNTLGIKSAFSDNPATGTTSDATAVSSLGLGEETRFTGAATIIGKMIGKAVVSAVSSSTEKWIAKNKPELSHKD